MGLNRVSMRMSMELPFFPPPIARCVQPASEQLKACVTTEAMLSAVKQKKAALLMKLFTAVDTAGMRLDQKRRPTAASKFATQ